MLVMKLSGEWLWPPPEEVDALVQANAVENPVEAVIRLRALAEISRHYDTDTLAALARYAQADDARSLALQPRKKALSEDQG